MKYLIIFLLFASCRFPKGQPVIIHDTIPVVIHDTIPIYKTDTVKNNCDSLRRKLFVSNYKLERVKYYLKICLKNPKQDQFLKGWIKRAVE